MPTTRSDGGGSFMRTNSVQKMLDLERKIKIEKMQAHGPKEPRRAPRSFSITTRGSRQPSRESSITPPDTRTDTRIDSRENSLSSQPHSHLHMKETSRKSSAIPSLRITVPPTKQETRVETTQRQPSNESGTQKTVTFLSAGRDVDLESDAASSICHSPSWENYGHKKKKERKGKEETEKEHRNTKNRPVSKLTKPPPPPPSASRTPYLAQRQITTPLLPSHYKQDRGRSSSSDRDGSASQSPESKPKRPKHNRARSTSLTNRIRSSIELLRGENTVVDKEVEVGFVGGLKLQQEREAAAQRASMPPPSMNHASSTPERPAPSPIQHLTSAHPPATPDGETASAPVSAQSRPTSAEKSESASPHRLRHKALPVGQRSSSLGSHALVSPTAPPVPIVPLSWTSGWLSESPTQDHSEQKPQATGGHDGQHEGQHEVDQGYFSQLRENKKQDSGRDSRGRSSSGKNDNDAGTAQSGSEYPPPKAYSSIQGELFSSPIRLKQTEQPDSPAAPNYLGPFDRQHTPPILDLQSPVSDTRSDDSRKDKRTSTMRSLRDAAFGVFNRRSTSRTPSRTGDCDSAASSRVVSPSEYSSTSCLSPKAARVLGAVTEKKERPAPANRPSDLDSISSYDDCHSQPSSVTTPDSSRPQSEKGTNPGGNETEKVLGGEEKPTLPALPPQDLDFGFASGSTPPLGPKSSKRPLSGKYEPVESPKLEGVEGELWTRSAMPVDMEQQSIQTADLGESNSNLSHVSLIPKPLVVSPRSSLDGPDKDSDATEKTNTNAKVESQPSCGIRRHPSIPKSRSSPDLQIVDTSFLPKLKHQPLQQRQHQAQKRNFSVPSPVIAQECASPKPIVNRSNPASYLEEARRSAPTAKPVRFKGRTPSALVDSRHGAEPLAKMFVECCSCKFYHDMPSRLYECMVNPEGTIEDAELGVHGVVTRCVKCPWCGHGMTTKCCAGYAAVVYLKERLH